MKAQLKIITSGITCSMNYFQQAISVQMTHDQVLGCENFCAWFTKRDPQHGLDTGVLLGYAHNEGIIEQLYTSEYLYNNGYNIDKKWKMQLGRTCTAHQKCLKLPIYEKASNVYVPGVILRAEKAIILEDPRITKSYFVVKTPSLENIFSI